MPARLAPQHPFTHTMRRLGLASGSHTTTPYSHTTPTHATRRIHHRTPRTLPTWDAIQAPLGSTPCRWLGICAWHAHAALYTSTRAFLTPKPTTPATNWRRLGPCCRASGGWFIERPWLYPCLSDRLLWGWVPARFPSLSTPPQLSFHHPARHRLRPWLAFRGIFWGWCRGWPRSWSCHGLPVDLQHLGQRL